MDLFLERKKYSVSVCLCVEGFRRKCREGEKEENKGLFYFMRILDFYGGDAKKKDESSF